MLIVCRVLKHSEKENKFCGTMHNLRLPSLTSIAISSSIQKSGMVGVLDGWNLGWMESLMD